MKKIIAFDLDGTLAESKTNIDTQMATLLMKLLGKYKVVIISGGDYPQFEKQVIPYITNKKLLKNFYFYPTSGTKGYIFKDNKFIKLYSEDLETNTIDKVLKNINMVVKELNLEPKRIYGDLIENRGTQITYSALGQEAPYDIKKYWDPDFSKRKKIKEKLEKLLPELSINMGGSTSIDITKKGIDKSYAIDKIKKQFNITEKEILFVGDALIEGGNDYAVFKAGVECIGTSGPEETKNIINNLLKQKFMTKKALITGITGQDGSYLAELLLEKGYEVHGIKRRGSSFNTERIDHLFNNPNFFLYYGDMTDSLNLTRLVGKVKPDEIYNLAAQSHVAVSFDMPEYTAESDALGTLRLLEAIRINGLEEKTKFYQASTSELFGGLDYNRPEKGYNEKSPMHPRSPYGCAKLYAMWITRNYKESYNIFACNGILFNHESPRRGETFVTRKITMAVAKISLGLQDKLQLGNLDAKRDWGHAKDYVKAMWLMLQQDKPKDTCIATGESYSVRDFVNWSFEEVGIEIEWKGKGIDEKGYDKKTGKLLVEVNPKYFRPAEVDFLLGDATKAKEKLGWKPKYTVKQMCKEMVKSDIEKFKKQEILKNHGYEILEQFEI